MAAGDSAESASVVLRFFLIAPLIHFAIVSGLLFAFRSRLTPGKQRIRAAYTAYATAMLWPTAALLRSDLTDRLLVSLILVVATILTTMMSAYTAEYWWNLRAAQRVARIEYLRKLTAEAVERGEDPPDFFSERPAQWYHVGLGAATVAGVAVLAWYISLAFIH